MRHLHRPASLRQVRFLSGTVLPHPSTGNSRHAKTRHRERCLIEACLHTQQPFVVDNTNPTKEDRRRYIETARAAGVRVLGYYFRSHIEECKQRNEGRCVEEQVPLSGVLGTYKRLELPSRDEGFDDLHYVSIGNDGAFVIEEWKDEV
ncbi:MAG: AAA family ATPase [Patescibacteria group bacterium]|nr:AAA family ATPase [Patescibacteria group bacterium]